MAAHARECVKCPEAVTTHATLFFPRGGVEKIPLCDKHAWDLYYKIARWCAEDGGREKSLDTAKGREDEWA